ncbi:MAG: hypothetical protein Q7J15_00530 [Candidatus Desulfaltia sp.]|nr:hypothetical protein [Candidatus Desulfaltia sp.]
MILYNRIATGSLIEKKRVHYSQFVELKLPAPFISEQTKIANFLYLVDKLITLQQQKRDTLEEYKRGMLQKLFSGKLLFTDSDNSYPNPQKKRIGDIYSERTERGQAEAELLSVTMSNGVIRRSELEGKDKSSTDKSNYKFVEIGDMVYNSMRMWQGANGISPYQGHC